MKLVETMIYARLNDWIIKSVRLENDLVNDIIENFKLAISYDETYYMPNIDLDLLDNMRMVEFLKETNYELPIYEKKESLYLFLFRNLTIMNIKIFYEDFK